MVAISAIMPVFNSEKYVRETIDSILNQSYSNFEFIIVNDGSADNTREIIENYNDKRIKLFNLEVNKGVGYASNYAVQKSAGKYIARVDSDDVYHQDRFILQKEYLDNNPDIALVKSLFEYFADEYLENTDRFNGLKNITEKYKNVIISTEDIAEKLYWSSCISNNTTMIRSEVLKEFGYKDMKCGEDYYLFYNMNKKGYKMGTVVEYLVRMRVSDTSKHGQIVSGLPVCSPDILQSNRNSGIVVASQPGRYSIVKELEKMNYKHLEDYVVYK